MKAVRFITMFIVLAIAFSVWSPTAVLAKPGTSADSSIIAKAKSGIVKISVTNKTGGVIYIQLTGAHNYYFVASNAGKNSFEILPGKYTYTLSTSACSGSVTRTKNFKGGSASLGQWYCRH